MKAKALLVLSAIAMLGLASCSEGGTSSSPVDSSEESTSVSEETSESTSEPEPEPVRYSVTDSIDDHVTIVGLPETAEEGEDDDDGTHQGGAPAQPVGDTGAHTADIPVFGADQAALPDPPEEHVTPVAFRCFVRFGLAGRIPIAVAGAGLACRRGIDVLALGVVVTALLAAATVRLTGLRLPRGLS